MARLHGARRRCLRAVADRGRRRPGRAADRRPALHLGLGCRAGAAPAVPAARGSPTCARARPSRPTSGCSTSGRTRGPSAPTPRRLTSFNADVLADIELREPVERHATVDGRDIQGWFLPGGDGAATARPRDPRRPAHALRLVAGLGVPDPRRGRDRRLLLQPARLRGLRRGVQRRQPPRLGPRADARRPGRRRRAGRRRPRRPRPPRRHRRLVRRLPDELDRRPRPALPGGDDLPLGQRHGRRCSRPATSPAATGRGSSSTRRRGTTRPTSARSRRSPTPTGSGRRCSSSTPSATSGRRSPRPRRCSPSCARIAGRSACCASPRRPTS